MKHPREKFDFFGRSKNWKGLVQPLFTLAKTFAFVYKHTTNTNTNTKPSRGRAGAVWPWHHSYQISVAPPSFTSAAAAAALLTYWPAAANAGEREGLLMLLNNCHQDWLERNANGCFSEKDCRQLSSAAQQGQDTSTRGVKGTQETPTHQAPAHPLLYLLSFPSFLNLATSPADHRPLTSPHVTSETFVCLPQLEDVPDSTWCWDWEAAAWWCAGGKCNTDKPNQTNLGGFRNAWQDDKQLQSIPHRNDKADQNWNWYQTMGIGQWPSPQWVFE